MTDEPTTKACTITQKDGPSWSFTPEAGKALGGIQGIIIFIAALGTMVKAGMNEISFKGYGLFEVTRRGRSIKVKLIEKDSE